MRSCLFEGSVRHRRIDGVPHEFDFPLFMVYLDHAELDDVFAGRWLWSTRGRAFAAFRREDHFGDPAVPLEQAIRDRVEEELGRRPAGPVRTLTHLRYAGYLINPVSLHYCFDQADTRADCVVAEVTNTPWGETHCYVVDLRDGDANDVTPKTLHVSPFMSLDMGYRWTLPTPGETLSVAIGNRGPNGERLFDAHLRMERREINGRTLAGALVRHPFMTLVVLAGIYWQALRLYLKSADFHPHPRRGEANLEITA